MKVVGQIRRSRFSWRRQGHGQRAALNADSVMIVAAELLCGIVKDPYAEVATRVAWRT